MSNCVKWTHPVCADNMVLDVISSWKHEGRANLCGFAFRYEGTDVNPYTVHTFRSMAKSRDGFDMYVIEFRSTYLYKSPATLYETAVRRLIEKYPDSFKSSIAYKQHAKENSL